MRMVVGGEVVPGYLDAARTEGTVRISPTRMVAMTPVAGQYFERAHDPLAVAGYLLEIGPRDVIRKVASRRAEAGRNDKHLSVGRGHLVDDAGAVGDPVLFVAPNHPAASERVVVASDLVWPDPQPNPHEATEQARPGPGARTKAVPAPLVGWDHRSGRALPDLSGLPEAILEICGSAVVERRLAASGGGLQERTDPAVGAAPGRLCVIGYGNYVKTMSLPELARSRPVGVVHEIDPLQIGPTPTGAWDTLGTLRDDEEPEVVLIASHHHEHVDLLEAAVARGARYVVMEKPPLTAPAQLERFCGAVAAEGTEIFLAYQRRYSPFTDHLRRDLGAADGAPISCRALVYEVPLPDLHWYRWPTSGSRMVANGGHWLDHFLHLNAYSAVEEVTVAAATGENLVVLVDLANGAHLELSLTDVGSSRLGVSDVCEFRTPGATARIVNMSKYRAEDSRRLRRVARRQRLHAHRAMYREIGRRIAAGEPGDTRRSLVSTASALAMVEDALTR